MSTHSMCLAALIAAAIVAGTISDVPPTPAVRMLGGYHVLAADFHVHSFPFTWSTLAPWDTVIEARYQGLDVIGMTPHDMVWAGKMGRWFSGMVGGPMVLVSEEVTAPGYHLLAVGITDAISPSLPISGAIDEVHRQGGVAIAAHPYKGYWPTYDAEALQKLDGSEVVRPEAQQVESLAAELRAFFSRAPLTAIGDSDYHGLGPLGYARTYVFARSPTEQGVLDAIRERRTVVYDRDRAYGDPAMIQLASSSGGLPSAVPDWPSPDILRVLSRIVGVLALAALVLFNKMT